jgi:hypothetical protein
MVRPFQPALGPPGVSYTQHARSLLERYPDTDYSRLDWMVCRDIALSSPAVDQAYFEQALREGSPHLAERKVGHVDEYIRHTAAKVLVDPLVATTRGRLTHISERLSGEDERHL